MMRIIILKIYYNIYVIYVTIVLYNKRNKRTLWNDFVSFKSHFSTRKETIIHYVQSEWKHHLDRKFTRCLNKKAGEQRKLQSNVELIEVAVSKKYKISCTVVIELSIHDLVYLEENEENKHPLFLFSILFFFSLLRQLNLSRVRVRKEKPWQKCIFLYSKDFVCIFFFKLNWSKLIPLTS